MHQRVDGHRADLVEGEDAEQHHGHRRDGVGLEEVRRHAGAVADVVAHVVGDHRRVARVVLGDAGLDLAHQVGAHVGRLGEDAAAQTGEHGDQRAAEAEAHERVDRVALVGAGQDQDPVVAGDAEQGQARHEQAGHRAALEGHLERAATRPLRADSATRALARTDTFMPMKPAAAEKVPPIRNPIAPGCPRDPGPRARREHDREHDRDAADDRVLAAQVGRRALLHGARDALHLVVAGRRAPAASGT